MASLFGLPLDAINNLSDTSAHLAPDEVLKEKMVFVGGRYQEKHDDVFRLFFLNVTDTTHIRVLTYTALKLFVLVLSTVILFCQIGFACMQSGASRKGSIIAPFVMNAINLAIAAVAFWSVGYAIARSEGNLILGYNDWFAHDTDTALSVDWYLYFTIAMTSVNIASSGGLERCPLWVMAMVSAVLSGIVYPLIIRWIWHYSGWMLKYSFSMGLKYEDIGGSGPIHAVGGAAALVLSLALGPRDERIQQKGSRVIVDDVNGHSVPMEVLGSYLVIICVLCINVVRGLSTFLGTDPTASFGRGLMNTLVAAAVCCLVTLPLSMLLKKFMGEWRFHWLYTRMITNTLIMGAVSVSGGCTVYSQWTSGVIGIVASIGYIIWTLALSFTNVDDVTGSVTVHLGGGLLGAICVPIFKQDTGLLFTDNTELAGMCLAWNLVCVLTMVAMTMVCVGVVILLPTMLEVVPLSPIQQLQGMDYYYLKQEAYSNGVSITPYNTDAIEDRETFSDSHLTTPLSQQALAFQQGFNQAYDNDGIYPDLDPETQPGDAQGISSSSLAYTSGSSLPVFYRDLPGQRDLTFQNNSRDLYPDRHVWFGGETVEPEFPLMSVDEVQDNSRADQHFRRSLEYC